MIFRIPGTQFDARLFEEVETVDPQYDIYDVGFRHPDGGIDSLAVGGSAYSLKKAIARMNARSNANVPAPVADKQPVAVGSVTDRTGVTVDPADL